MKKLLTKEIIENDIKYIRRFDLMIVIVSLILMVSSGINVFKHFGDNNYVYLAGSTLILLICISNLYSFIIWKLGRKNYTIVEGVVEKSVYDEKTKESKVVINGYKKFAFALGEFNINDSVYLVIYKNRLLTCYSKNKYYM